MSFPSFAIAAIVALSLISGVSSAETSGLSIPEVRQHICASQRSFSQDESDMQKELNLRITNAIKFEGVASLNQLVSRAYSRKLKLLTRFHLRSVLELALILNDPRYSKLKFLYVFSCLRQKGNCQEGECARCEKFIAETDRADEFRDEVMGQVEYIRSVNPINVNERYLNIEMAPLIEDCVSGDCSAENKTDSFVRKSASWMARIIEPLGFRGTSMSTDQAIIVSSEGATFEECMSREEPPTMRIVSPFVSFSHK